MPLTLTIPWLQCNYNFTFYIADVNDNILGLDFLEDKGCRNLTVSDMVTNHNSVRNNSTASLNHNPVLAVSLDQSQVTDRAL